MAANSGWLGTSLNFASTLAEPHLAMQIDPIPIEQFIVQKFQLPSVKRVLDTLAVDPERLIVPLTRHFHDMGIYLATPRLERILLDGVVQQLKESPDVRAVVVQAARERARNLQRR